MERTGTFQNSRIKESSGVAVSRRQPGILWTHNDSGDEPNLYATNPAGADLGTFRVTGASARDWEDIALASCPQNPRADCLYVADTGDNVERHAFASVYIVPEPTVPSRPRSGPMVTQPAHRLKITYPDGAHDVEALAVAPDGEMSLFTKGHSGVIQRFIVPAAARLADSVVAQAAETLAVIGRGNLAALVTAAAFAPDGNVLALRTYTQILFFEWGPQGWSRREPSCWIGPRETQGEGIDFLDARTLVLTTEAVFTQPGAIDRVRCPETGTR